MSEKYQKYHKIENISKTVRPRAKIMFAGLQATYLLKISYQKKSVENGPLGAEIWQRYRQTDRDLYPFIFSRYFLSTNPVSKSDGGTRERGRPFDRGMLSTETVGNEC